MARLRSRQEKPLCIQCHNDLDDSGRGSWAMSFCHSICGTAESREEQGCREREREETETEWKRPRKPRSAHPAFSGCLIIFFYLLCSLWPPSVETLHISSPSVFHLLVYLRCCCCLHWNNLNSGQRLMNFPIFPIFKLNQNPNQCSS